jgi:ferrous iron transport protein A
VIISVAELKPNQTGTVVQINTGPGRARQLLAIGIRPGAQITGLVAQPLCGPVTVRVGNTEVALGFGIARRILVEVPE